MQNKDQDPGKKAKASDCPVGAGRPPGSINGTGSWVLQKCSIETIQ